MVLTGFHPFFFSSPYIFSTGEKVLILPIEKRHEKHTNVFSQFKFAQKLSLSIISYCGTGLKFIVAWEKFAQFESLLSSHVQRWKTTQKTRSNSLGMDKNKPAHNNRVSLLLYCVVQVKVFRIQDRGEHASSWGAYTYYVRGSRVGGGGTQKSHANLMKGVGWWSPATERYTEFRDMLEEIWTVKTEDPEQYMDWNGNDETWEMLAKVDETSTDFVTFAELIVKREHDRFFSNLLGNLFFTGLLFREPWNEPPSILHSIWLILMQN